MASATPRVQGWLREAGQQPLFAVRSHIAAETTADTDAICATVAKDVFFAVPLRTRSGNELPPGAVLTSHDEVRDYYAGRADSYVVLDSAQLKSFASSWYVFNESAATLRATGAIGSADAAGSEFVVNSAILFPTAPDGIRGEICVTRHPFEDVVTGDAPALPGSPTSFPAREMDHTAALDRLLDALRDGSAAAIGTCLAERHTLALRADDVAGRPSVYRGTRRAEAAEALAQVFSGCSDVALVARLSTDWYVFAEYLAPLAAGRVRRLAAIHPIEGDGITGTFGYGRDEEAPDAR